LSYCPKYEDIGYIEAELCGGVLGGLLSCCDETELTSSGLRATGLLGTDPVHWALLLATGDSGLDSFFTSLVPLWEKSKSGADDGTIVTLRDGMLLKAPPVG